MPTSMPKFVSVMMVVMIVLSACVFRPPSGGLTEQERQQTAVIETIAARLTEQVALTAVAQLTQIAQPTGTSIPLLPTETNIPIVEPPTSIPPTPTYTPVNPTNTPTWIPTYTRVPTIAVITVAPPSDWAQVVADLGTPEGGLVTSGQKFTKTWRLKNIGTTTWTTSYALVFVSGNAMGGSAAYPLVTNVNPGSTIDISVGFTAPTSAGEHKGYWMLRTASGKLFGVGNKADASFPVTINVSPYRSDPVPASIYPYDFAANICQARWINNYGGVTLPCTGYDVIRNSWASITLKPRFETGREDDERTIWVRVDGKLEGYVQGLYPAYTVKANDHLKTWIGCLDNSKSCKVLFSIDASINGAAPVSLGKWEEIHDGKIRQIDIDLSIYAGKQVAFLLGVSNKSTATADVFWFVPSIQNIPPTATPSPSPTATATATPTLDGYPPQ